ncbi:DUF6449 domain-containing protein [Paenibacillus sp. NFR01]|uniref:DUF6449 domain-containing protein n=1 Tax=Paenibacillus sp. NFR01 TaxID=1566279 RepID=UPI0008ADA342|nr:DUF6449 domain-containing protein [Paenibacillus sp. NFR01]SEU00971.1 ABC-2 type transport system permease protein [Paenibacillus sp. NFR01]
MTRSRYLFNGGVLRQNMRQHGWVGIIYLLGLLFALPLQMLLAHQEDVPAQEIHNLFQIADNVQTLFILIVPVAAALFQFRYLQAKHPSDLWHSLPLRRGQLLFNHMASGLFLLLVPVWLVSLLSGLLMPLDSNGYAYQAADVWNWCVTASVITLFFYVFSVFVGICMGQTVLQGIVIYILMLLPAFLLMLLDKHFSMYLYGYPNYDGIYGDMGDWSPVYTMLFAVSSPVGGVKLWVYAGLSVLFTALSYLLYRKRHAEKSGYAIVFTYFNPLFKAGVMLCAMLLCGTYFGSLKDKYPGWVIAGYLAGALIGYLAAEMVIRKSWHVLSRKAVREFAVYAVLLGIVIYLPVSNWNGYEARVPDTDRITAAYVGDEYRMYAEDSFMTDSPSQAEPMFSSDKSYIAAARGLHQALATARPVMDTSANSNRTYRYYDFVYKLNNGRTLHRAYWVPSAGFEPELKALMENAEFKRKEYKLYALNAEVEGFRITNGDKVLNISDPGEVAELKALLEKENLNMSYADQTGNQMPYASFQTLVKPDESGYQAYYSYYWYPSFDEMTTWFEKNGYTAKIRTLPQQIKSVEIVPGALGGTDQAGYYGDLQAYFTQAEGENRAWKTEDQAAIADVLDRQRYVVRASGAYLVKIEYPDPNEPANYVMLEEQDLTPALKALIR